jgi:Zn-dependent protease with chaperone function
VSPPSLLCRRRLFLAALLLACVAAPTPARADNRTDAQARKQAEAERKRAEEAERKRVETERKRSEEARRKAEEEARRRREQAPQRLLLGLVVVALLFTFFYLAVMGAMCLAGLVLARFTTADGAAGLLDGASGRLVSAGKVARTVHETRLALVYAITLTAALVLFYLALPFVFGGLLLVFVALLFLRRGDGGSGLHTSLLRASGGGMGAVLRAAFARPADADSGLRKRPRDCPRLYKVLDEVADRVDTEPVDEVYLAPGSEFSVYQEGRGPFGAFGSRKRVLTLGLCVMHFLTVSEFKAILAHEYAHFSHADTYWSRFLFQVTLSLHTALREMDRTGGWVTRVNPFYWFFWLYARSYRLLASGFSRSREFLADRMACSLYGSDVFTAALAKVCTDGALFEMAMRRQVQLLLRHRKAYVNVYLAFRKLRDEQLSRTERDELYRKLLDDEPSLYASHPTFAERLRAAQALPPAGAADATSALHLFEQPEEVEKELTDYLTEAVHDAQL